MQFGADLETVCLHFHNKSYSFELDGFYSSHFYEYVIKTSQKSSSGSGAGFQKTPIPDPDLTFEKRTESGYDPKKNPDMDST